MTKGWTRMRWKSDRALVNPVVIWHKMKIFLKLIIANAAMFICVVAGSFLPGLWSGVSGRDIRPQAVNVGILILVVSFLLRFRFKWPILQMFFCLVPTQLIILFCISCFSGYSGWELFHEFNIEWLFFIDIFIAAPWIIGIFIGSIILMKKTTIH
jgi:hypothetical protein